MKLTVAFQNSDVVLAVDVSPDMSVEDFMAYALNEAGFPLTGSTALEWQDQTLDRSKVLHDYGVGEDDMVVISSGPSNSSNTASRARAQAGAGAGDGAGARAGARVGAPGQSGRITAAQVEQVRQEILYNPQLFTEFSEKMPELASAVHDPEEFAQAFAERQILMQNMQGNNWVNQLSQAMNPTPEMLAQRELDENLSKAMEEMPESFVPVTMLYIPIEINGHPVKAFVDSGAQSTILSPECAKRCELEHLVDKRYKGTAYGVGTSEIIGRIHMAPIKIGSGFFPCGFTVLEGIKMDMLFGLDMLRHHQAVISLRQNALILGDESVSFLGEADLPEEAKTQHKQQSDVPAQPPRAAIEPKPTPTTNPATKPSGPSFANVTGAGNSLGSRPQGYQQAPPPPHNPNQSHTQSQNQEFRPPAGAPPSSGNKFDESVVQNLISFGFSRDKVLNALQRADGSAEIAASILFDES